MSAKYSLLVVAVVVTILIVNSLWVKLASQQNNLQNTEAESQPVASQSRKST